MTPRAGRRSRYQAASTRLPTATRRAASTGPISWFRRSGATRIRCSSSALCATSRTSGSTATTSATTRGATRRLRSTPLARWCPARTTTSWFASTIRCGGRATTSSRGAWPIGGTTAGSSVTCGSKPSPRRVASTAPRVLLNGEPIVFNGVALHEERQMPVREGLPGGGPLTSVDEIASVLARAQGVHADLIRVDHHPPNQMLPVLADRLGLALWEEIALYHFTPQTFSIAMDRGIPQQMLAEMDLRDFNRPSVLFHVSANASA